MNAEDLPLARRVPTLPAPPHDPYSLLLGGTVARDAATGWRVRGLQDVDIAAGAPALVLAPAPGAQRSAAEPSGSFGGLRPPLNVAVTGDGAVLLLDPVAGGLWRFDSCCCAFKPLPCATRAPEASPDACALPPQRRRVPLDQVRDATGLATCGHTLYIADGGHHRVLRWDLQALAPRGELRLPASEGAALVRPWTPGSMAVDGRGRLYVADAVNLRIDRFDAGGRWQRRFATRRPPWHIAIDCHDRLHAVLLEAAGVVPVAGAGASTLWQWQSVGPDAPEVVRWSREEDATPEPLPLRSDRLAGFAAPALAIDAEGRLQLPCAGADTVAPLFDARGRPVRPEGRGAPSRYRRRGDYFSQPLDSRIDDCTWHRVELRGRVPAGCSIAVRTLTANVPLSDAEVDEMGAAAWSAPVLATAVDAAGRWDALVRSAPGRHAWLWLELAGDGFETPQLDAVLVEYPRISLRRYLPAVFGSEPGAADFTDRFTAIFDASLRSIERRLDGQAGLFDPLSAPAEGLGGHADFLAWLGSWIGLALARDWPEARRRQYLKAAARWYPRRGTPDGLQGQLLLLLGIDRAGQACLAERPPARRHGQPSRPAARCVPLPLNCAPAPERLPAAPPQLVLEHFRLRRWLFAGRSRLGDDSVLWGERIVNRSQLGASVPPTPVACPPATPADAAVADPAPLATGSARTGHSQLIGTPDPRRDPLLVHANRISVFVPACVRARPAEERALRRLLATEVPAHVEVQLHLVEPRFRVGVQAMVGLDSVIARTPHGVALGATALGAGSVLPADPATPPRAGRMRVGGPAGLR